MVRGFCVAGFVLGLVVCDVNVASAQFSGLVPKTRSAVERTTPLSKHLAGAGVDTISFQTEMEEAKLDLDTIGPDSLPFIYARTREEIGLDEDDRTTARTTAALESYRALVTKGWAFPITLGRDGLTQYYERFPGDPRLLRDFSANVRHDQILALVDLISGGAGPILLSATTAAVVTEDDEVKSGDAPSDSVVAEGLTSNLTRLIYNGGTASIRAAAPYAIYSSDAVRFAAAAVVQGGVLGSLSQPDSLKAAFTVTHESMFYVTVSKPERNEDGAVTGFNPAGSIVFPLRVGFAWSESDFASGVLDTRSFGFLQAGVGITDIEGQFKLAILYTLPFPSAVQEFVPRLSVSLGATR